VEKEEDRVVVCVAGKRKGGVREGFIERDVELFIMIANA